MRLVPSVLNVHGNADGKEMFLGRLSYLDRENSSAFEWSEEAIASGLEWSPLNLPLSRNLWVSTPREQDLLGLPGLIHDSLPDGWGLLLMDRAFTQAGLPRHEISPLVRLAFLADRCWGALTFSPEWGEGVPKQYQMTIESLAQEAQQVMEGDTEQVSRALLVAGGSPHGARPKVMVAVNEDLSHALVGQETLPPGYRHVLIKFASDDEDPSQPLLEFCYTQAARNVGITTAPAQMIQVGRRWGFCAERFDRKNGQRQHVHSMAGILHTTHRISNADWENVAGILKALPGGGADLGQAFRRAVFNSVFCVRDDHTKNLSFMRGPSESWGLSPAYDLAYCDGPGGYHTMTYAHHAGKNVSMEDLLRLARVFDVPVRNVGLLVEEALAQREEMLRQAKGLGVRGALLSQAQQRYREIDRGLGRKAAPRKKTRP